MEEGKAPQDHVSPVEAEQGRRGDLSVAAQVEVGELGPLRVAGGPRGVENDRGVLSGAAGEDRIGIERGEDPVELARCHVDRQSGSGPGCIGDLAGNFVPDEEETGARVLQVVLDLPRLEQQVHGHHHSPSPQHAVVDGRERGDVGQHDPGPVTRQEARRAQQAGDAPRRLVEFGVGEDGFVQAEGPVVRVPGGSLDEAECKVRHWPIVVVGHASVDVAVHTSWWPCLSSGTTP